MHLLQNDNRTKIYEIWHNIVNDIITEIIHTSSFQFFSITTYNLLLRCPKLHRAVSIMNVRRCRRQIRLEMSRSGIVRVRIAPIVVVIAVMNMVVIVVAVQWIWGSIKHRHIHR